MGGSSSGPARPSPTGFRAERWLTSALVLELLLTPLLMRVILACAVVIDRLVWADTAVDRGERGAKRRTGARDRVIRSRVAEWHPGPLRRPI